jgi:hypothetical protein
MIRGPVVRVLEQLGGVIDGHFTEETLREACWTLGMLAAHDAPTWCDAIESMAFAGDVAQMLLPKLCLWHDPLSGLSKLLLDVPHRDAGGSVRLSPSSLDGDSMFHEAVMRSVALSPLSVGVMRDLSPPRPRDAVVLATHTDPERMVMTSRGVIGVLPGRCYYLWQPAVASEQL